MTIAKRLVLVLLVATMFGTAACSDSTGPKADTAPCENQGTGGRCS
jgi:hypothetical protein